MLLWRISRIATIVYGAMPLLGMLGFYAGICVLGIYEMLVPERFTSRLFKPAWQWFRKGIGGAYELAKCQGKEDCCLCKFVADNHAVSG